MAQLTAATRDEVMVWLETTQHHEAIKTEEFFILKGYNDTLKIPKKLWKRCFTKSGGNFDSRMYRWDFEAHKAHVAKLREKRKTKFYKPKPKSRLVEEPANQMST